MPAPKYPGGYVEETPSGAGPISPAATSIAAFLGKTKRGPVNKPILLTSFAEFERTFGGVWKWSPLGFAVSDFFQNGGTQAVIVRLRITQLTCAFPDAEAALLNARAINCLRPLSTGGPIIWGGCTLQGDDDFGSEWKYIAVRRLALFLETSIARGTRWAVFEPNDEPLWAQIRLNVGAFLHDLFRQGAFQGKTPAEACFIKCDRSTTTAADLAAGYVCFLVGFAPLKPAEFVVLSFRQPAGRA